MLRTFGSHIRNQWIGALALFLVLGGGTAYAVTHLDKDSVRSQHIVDGQVKPKDLNKKSQPMWALIDDDSGNIVRSSPGVHIDFGAVGGSNYIGFPKSVKGRALVATVRSPDTGTIDLRLCGESASEEDDPCGAQGSETDNPKHVYVHTPNDFVDFYIAALPRN
jgi:hypothetical protein